MAGDEPSEDPEAGADAEEAADGTSSGDGGEDLASGGPASEGSAGGAREDATAGAGPEDDASDEDGDGAESADETDPDDPEGSSDDETDGEEDDAEETGVDGTDDGGETEVDGTDIDEVEVEETDGVEESDVDEAVDAEAETLLEEMDAAVAEADPEALADGEDGGDDAEIPPMAPDHEADPDVDAPVPSIADDAEVQAPEDDGEPPDHAGPVVEDAGGVDAAEGAIGGGRSGPAEDREMPLADHIREMLQRLAVVVAVAGLVSLLVIPFAGEIINFLWYSILPGVESEIARPRLYGVLVLWFTRIKVASIAGLVVALPVMVYETYAFMRPGLYPHERRYYLAAIPTSLVLAIVGVAFAYFVVLPTIFVYFLYYSQDVATIGFALGRTFDLILLMMGYLAVVFQIPLFLMLAMMMGLVTRRWLADRRLLFWMAFLGISFLFSFDPTGMAPIIVAATMIVLFEGTLLLTKWTGRE